MVFIYKNAIYLAVSMFVIGILVGINIDEVRYPYSESSISINSPSDKITVNDLKVYNDKAVISVPGLIWARIEDTKSMEPVLNSDSISLELKPSIDDIQVGDIISFKQDNIVKIHRVIEIGDDGEWYCVTKGDNNLMNDGKVRFSQIEGVVVGILY